MASNINSSNINGAYPIAGQDNDSQGFRDNFTNIKNNLKAAAEEITALQSSVVFKKPLQGTITVANDFAGTVMTGAVTAGFTETKYEFNNSPQSGTVTLDFNLGDNQWFQTGGPVTLKFTNWPSPTVYSKMRLMIDIAHVSGITDTVTFPAEVSIGASQIPLFNTTTSKLTPVLAGKYFFEFSTFDGGSTVIAELLAMPGTYNGVDITALNSNVTTLQSNVTTIRSNITTIQGNISTLTSTLGNVSSNLSSLTTTVNNIVAVSPANFSTLAGNVYTLETTVTSTDANVATLQNITSSLPSVISNILLLQGNVNILQGNVTSISSLLVTHSSDIGILTGNILTLTGNLSNVTTLLTNQLTGSGNVVLKNTNNIMNGTVISGATQMVENIGAATGIVSIDFNSGEFKSISPAAPITVSFTGWPVTGYARLRVNLNITNTTQHVVFPNEVVMGLNKIAGVTGQTLYPSAGNYLLEFGTANGGATVWVIPLITP
jgi:hypothetical protein